MLFNSGELNTGTSQCLSHYEQLVSLPLFLRSKRSGNIVARLSGPDARVSSICERHAHMVVCISLDDALEGAFVVGCSFVRCAMMSTLCLILVGRSRHKTEYPFIRMTTVNGTDL